MKQYQADYRAGRRRADAKGKVTGRTQKARAAAEAKRKKLWAMENHEWRMQQQRERRRAAAAAERARLLEAVSKPASEAEPQRGRKADKSDNNQRKERKAA